jgi:hypothetical protein
MKNWWCTVAFCGLLLAVNSGNVWGAEDRTAAPDLRSEHRVAPRQSTESDPDLQESKRAKFKMLEWVIMQDLLAKYQKLEKNEVEVDTED